MTTKIKNIDTIEFKDRGDGGIGVVIIRQYGDQVALCLSLEENGDVEVLMDREVAERLIESLREAISK